MLKLVQCQFNSFTAANLRVLQQIAERIAIAVDNALACQQIKSLKEKLLYILLEQEFERVGGKQADPGGCKIDRRHQSRSSADGGRQNVPHTLGAGLPANFSTSVISHHA